jgi:hypothetical protein
MPILIYRTHGASRLISSSEGVVAGEILSVGKL